LAKVELDKLMLLRKSSQENNTLLPIKEL